MRASTLAATACCATAVTACLDADVAGPGPDDDVRVVYVGAPVADSIDATVSGVRFFVSFAGSEDAPVRGERAFFEARGEGCGVAEDPSDRTDDEGFAETRWRLGAVAGPCSLRVRVLNASNILLAFADIEADVLPGQAETLLWIAEGGSVAGEGSLRMTGSEAAAFDRLANEVPWRFRVLSGPLQAVGEALGSDGARTLVPAGGTGPGRVAVETRWGDVVVLDACVRAAGGVTTLTLDWTTAPGVPVCAP